MIRSKYFSISILCVLLIGMVIFSRKDNPSNYKKKRPTFYSKSLKEAGEMTPEDKKLYDAVKKDNQEFLNSLSEQERNNVQVIISKVKAEVQKNNKVRIEYRKILSPEEYKMVSKIRKRRSEFRKKMNLERGAFSSMIKKLSLDEIITVYNGVK